MRNLVLLLATLLLAPWPARAQDQPGQVHLSLERFESMMAAAQGTTGPQPTWSRGTISVALPEGPEESLAVVELEADVHVVGTGRAEVALLPGDVILEEASLNGSPAPILIRSGAHVAVFDGDTRDASVTLRYSAPVRTAPDGEKVLIVPMPRLPGATMTLSGAPRSVPLRIWPAGEVKRSGDTAEAVLPATVAAVVGYGDAARAHRIRRVDYELSVVEDIDAVDVRAAFEVWMGATRSEIPVAGAEVALTDLRVDGAPVPSRALDDWHHAIVEGKGRRTLVARFRLPVDRSEGQPQATIQLPKASIIKLDATLTGQREIEVDPQVPLEKNLVGKGASARTRASGYLPPSEAVTVRWTETRPSEEARVRVNSETYQIVTISEGVLRSRVFMRFHIIRGKARELSLQIPEDAVLYKVKGEGIEDWRTYARTEQEPRQAKVVLGKEHEGDYALELELESVISREEGAAVRVPVVRPLGMFRESGVVGLVDGDKVSFAPAEQRGYAKVGEDALPSDIRQVLTQKVAQAFKHVGEPADLRSKVAAAKAKDVRFDARVQALYLVKEGALAGNASVLIELKSGRQDKVILTIPEKVAVLGVTAPSLNKAEPAKDFDAGAGRKGHEVRFTQPLEGAIQIDMEFELLLGKELGAIAVPDVRVYGAEVQEGTFGIAAETGIEVTQGAQKDLRRLDVTELPKSVRLRSPKEVLLGYSYAHVPWSLEVEVKRHKTVETLEAVARSARFQTTVLEDGHVVTRALFAVRNEDRQYLRLNIPKSAKVWTVAVAGKPVKAVSDDSGALAIPLPRREAATVEVVYDLRRARLGSFAKVTLQGPRADLVVTNLIWQVHVPNTLTAVHVHTELNELGPHMAVAREELGGASPLPTQLQTQVPMRTLHYTRAVQDASEAPPEISMVLSAAPPDWLGGLLLLIAFWLFAIVVYRRAAHSPLKAGGGLSLLLAFALIIATGAAYGISATEGLVIILGLLAVAMLGWRARHKAEAT